jgi:hypothetical protein
MNFPAVLFVTSVLLIYFSLHLGLFFLLRKFFAVTGASGQVLLGLVLLLLALSFIFSFIWTLFSSRGLIRLLYWGSAVWVGVLVNALMIFGLGLVFWKSAGIFGLTMKPKTFGWALVPVTVFYSLYGLINAQDLRTTALTVSLKNLPPSWEGKRIAQISDVHLGIIHRETLVRKMVSRIREKKADLIVITGDLFDGTGDDLADSVRPFRELDIPILYIIGNHETYLGLEKALAAVSGTPIRLLRDERIELEGLQILGVDFPGRWQKKDLEPLLKGLDRSKPALLLTHAPTQIETARRYGVSLHLCGHTHQGQMWPMPWITHWVFQGYDYGLQRVGDYTIYTSSGAGTWGPPMRIGSRPEVAVITLERTKGAGP